MLKLPETLVYELQPYGVETLGDLSFSKRSIGEGRICFDVHGVVVKGSQTSRIFQHTSTKSTKGERRTIYGVTQEDVDTGRIVKVAM